MLLVRPAAEVSTVVVIVEKGSVPQDPKESQFREEPAAEEDS